MKLTFLEFWKSWSDARKQRRQRRQRHEDWDREYDKKMERQAEASRVGGEIEPPWILWPGQMNWNQGNEEYYFHLWVSYIARLPEPERLAYLEKWKVPEKEQWQQWMNGC